MRSFSQGFGRAQNHFRNAHTARGLTLYAPASEVALWAAGKYLGDVEFTDASALPEPFKASSDDFLLVLTEVRTTS
jgi:hypothetical protein